jgi:divalent metal cation (Fe/Co/Zn/Cd) transporter
MLNAQPLTTDLQQDLIRRGRYLQYLSISWMIVEATVGITAGVLAGSVALVGFGADSVIELFSSFVLIWRLRAGATGEHRERTALKLVGYSFLALGGYVAFEATRDLILHRPPEASYMGIGLAAVAFVTMPILARAKRRVAAGLRSEAMHADSRQTDFCCYLSGILLGGLALNARFHWWWADPAAAMLMVPLIALEAARALRGKSCCDSES